MLDHYTTPPCQRRESYHVRLRSVKEPFGPARWGRPTGGFGISNPSSARRGLLPLSRVIGSGPRRDDGSGRRGRARRRTPTPRSVRSSRSSGVGGRPSSESAPRATGSCGCYPASAGFRGAGDGTRTRDNLLGRQALYQLSYSRGSRGERTRTSGLSVPNAARYQLRHTPRLVDAPTSIAYAPGAGRPQSLGTSRMKRRLPTWSTSGPVRSITASGSSMRRPPSRTPPCAINRRASLFVRARPVSTITGTIRT